MLGTVQKRVQRMPLETSFLSRGLVFLGSDNVGEGQVFLGLQIFLPYQTAFISQEDRENDKGMHR